MVEAVAWVPHLGYGEGHQSSDSTTNTNSNLLAKNINIETTNDASFKGATVKADDTLNLKVGGDLSVESQRDSSSSNSNGFNVSVSVSASLGSDKEYTANERKNYDNKKDLVCLVLYSFFFIVIIFSLAVYSCTIKNILLKPLS